MNDFTDGESIKGSFSSRQNIDPLSCVWSSNELISKEIEMTQFWVCEHMNWSTWLFWESSVNIIKFSNSSANNVIHEFLRIILHNLC